MNNIDKATEYLESLPDEMLLEIVEDLKLDQVPEGSILRTVVRAVYGDTTIFVLQCQQLLWPLLEVISYRFKVYSPHIIKN